MKMAEAIQLLYSCGSSPLSIYKYSEEVAKNLILVSIDGELRYFSQSSLSCDVMIPFKLKGVDDSSIDYNLFPPTPNEVISSPSFYHLKIADKKIPIFVNSFDVHVLEMTPLSVPPYELSSSNGITINAYIHSVAFNNFDSVEMEMKEIKEEKIESRFEILDL